MVRVKLCLMITETESGYGGMGAEISKEVLPKPDAAAEARQALEGLSDLLPTERLEDIRLLVSELVTNSVVHAGLSPEETVTVTVTVQGGSRAARCATGVPASSHPGNPPRSRIWRAGGACT